MGNVIKFQSPFERLKLFDNSPDVNLRKAIITQAIIDASNISDDKQAKKLEREAKSWISGCGEYFKNICAEACMEPQYVVKLAKQIIKLHKIKAKNKIRKTKASSIFKDSIRDKRPRSVTT